MDATLLAAGGFAGLPTSQPNAHQSETKCDCGEFAGQILQITGSTTRKTSTPQKQHIRDTSMRSILRTDLRYIPSSTLLQSQKPNRRHRGRMTLTPFMCDHFPYPLTTHCGIATHPTQPTPHMRTNLIQIVHQQKTHNLSNTMSHNANEPQSLVIFHPEAITQNESKHPNHPKTIQCATAFRRIFDAVVPTETPCEATFPVSVCACTRRVWGCSACKVAGQASRWSRFCECAILERTRYSCRAIELWSIRLNSSRRCSFFEIFLAIVTKAYTTVQLFERILRCFLDKCHIGSFVERECIRSWNILC